jgi:hypothetical protein
MIEKLFPHWAPKDGQPNTKNADLLFATGRGHLIVRIYRNGERRLVLAYWLPWMNQATMRYLWKPWELV